RADQGGGRMREMQVGYTIFPTEHDRIGHFYALSKPPKFRSMASNATAPFFAWSSTIPGLRRKRQPFRD
ncbi:MAG: hypothetical protein V1253_02395, partial [Alphaproteobacteria bacterium]|nr:hypothetical protein [Alphaproteobacteria bacterium]